MNLSKKVGTIIGAGTVIDGNIFCDGDLLHVDGKVVGEINCTGTFVVGREGVVEGNVSAGNVSLSGVLKGNVKAEEKVEILSKAKMYGDISTKGIAIEDNAVFIGRCMMEEASRTEKETTDATKETAGVVNETVGAGKDSAATEKKAAEE